MWKCRREIIDLRVRQILRDPRDIYGFKCLEGFVRNTAETPESESWWKQMPRGSKNPWREGDLCESGLLHKRARWFHAIENARFTDVCIGRTHFVGTGTRDCPDKWVYNKISRKYRIGMLGDEYNEESLLLSASTLISCPLYRQF